MAMPSDVSVWEILGWIAALFAFWVLLCAARNTYREDKEWQEFLAGKTHQELLELLDRFIRIDIGGPPRRELIPYTPTIEELRADLRARRPVDTRGYRKELEAMRFRKASKP